MKNNIDYFTHDSHSYEHPKFKMLRVKYKWEGYGKFWALNEIIAQSEDCTLDLSQKYNLASTASDLGFTIEELESFIDYLCDDCGLLICKDGKITTERVQDVFEKVMNERNRSKTKRNQGSNKGRPSTDHGRLEKNHGQISQSKVKETKVNNKGKFYTEYLQEESNKNKGMYLILETFAKLNYKPSKTETIDTFTKWIEEVARTKPVIKDYKRLKTILLEFETYWSGELDSLKQSKKNWKSTFLNYYGLNK